jgi:lambda family phage portal protein
MGFADDPMWRACFGSMPSKAVDTSPPTVAVSQLPAVRYGWDTGEKFPGGIGPVNLLWPDYWTLRQRSAELYERNLYARGLIRCLITNEINTGLQLEATPEEVILGVEEDGLADWSETVENRFALWARDAQLCDHNERLSFGALQALARTEALVVGDVLVVMRQDQRTRLPRVQLIGGSSVRTPMDAKPANGNRIEHGVELDGQRRHVAYWITQEEKGGQLASKRLPAFGEKSGKRIAWLLYGTDKRLDDVRGKPLLSLVLQSLNEIDRYRDATQRKAVVNSMLAMFVKKTESNMGTLPITGGAVRRGIDVAIDTSGKRREFRTAEHIPGLVLDELQHGEEPVAFQVNGTTENFGTFEEAILQTIAWATQVPPEILRKAFSSNYSASQAAVNEFKMYLNQTRTWFGETFCQRIYEEWLVAEVLAQRIEAPGFLEAWRDWKLFDKLGAWTHADWSGHIKPSVDLTKLTGGYDAMIAMGAITRARATRELTGTKFSKNVQQLKRENDLLAEANKSMVELEKPPAPASTDEPGIDDEPIDEEDDEESAAANVLPLRRGQQGN